MINHSSARRENQEYRPDLGISSLSNKLPGTAATHPPPPATRVKPQGWDHAQNRNSSKVGRLVLKVRQNVIEQSGRFFR
jgi:hypothetical protein